MANYANLEAAIVAAVYENANNEITGAALQSVLLQMVSSMGKSGMLCNGVADGSTTPPVDPDSNIFYIAPTGTYPNFGGLVVADGEWAIFIYNGSWQKQSVPVVTADAVPTTGSTNPVQSGGVADALEQKADIDGYYSTLTAGAAENLVGRGSVLAEYTRRTSGGSASIGSGAATIEKIHGNTIVWNQLINAASVSYTNLGLTITAVNGHYTISGTASGNGGFALLPRINTVAGHKYFVHLVGTHNFPSANWRGVDMSTLHSIVFTETVNTSNVNLQINVTSGQAYSADYWYYVCDLTLMGLTSVTATEFESLFPLNYYSHNTGSLLSLTGTGIETNGFNQWDEETELGTYNATTGAKEPASTQRRNVNPIAVFPSTTYYTNKVLYRYFYDCDMNLVLYDNSGSNLFTTPANAAYMNIRQAIGIWDGTETNINLSWSGYRNGEYEAYWDSTLALPITTVTSGGSAVFADGMKGAGTAYDELTGTKAVKRMGIVNLGNLTDWEVYSNDTTGHTFRATLTGAKAVPNESTVANIKAAIYTTRQFNWPSDWMNYDKVVCQTTAAKNLFIRDTAYSNAATFKTAMNGVYLVYELDTPTEYTLDSEVNLNYRVDDFGTETLLPQNNATPTTAPIIYDVRYAMNAVDTLRNLPKNYISKDSMEHILTAMVTAGVISAYTLTWNATNENYDCTITA